MGGILNKLAINVSNLSKGGGAQIAIWLLKKLIKDEHIRDNFTCFVSPFIFSGIKNELTLTKKDINVHVIQVSPVRSLASKKQILAVVNDTHIELVFTLHGPSGIDFPCREISGVANAWITCAKWSDYFKVYGMKAPVEVLKYIVHGLSLRKKDFLIFETDVSRNNFCAKFLYPKKRTRIIPNTVNDCFYNKVTAVPQVDCFNILFVSAYYKHKNFEMLPKYAVALKKAGKISNFKFQLTLSEKEFSLLSGVIEKYNCENLIENLGVLSVDELPPIYQAASLVISPSVVETFSATYAEAILSGRYLAVADKKFSREICKEAAFYFDPYNVDSFTQLVDNIYSKNNVEIVDKALAAGQELFITPEARYSQIVSLIFQKNTVNFSE